MMGPILCPETSIQNYHLTPCNTPEECRSHLHRCGSLKSGVVFISNTVHPCILKNEYFLSYEECAFCPCPSFLSSSFVFPSSFCSCLLLFMHTGTITDRATKMQLTVRDAPHGELFYPTRFPIQESCRLIFIPWVRDSFHRAVSKFVCVCEVITRRGLNFTKLIINFCCILNQISCTSVPKIQKGTTKLVVLVL
jgi:hypothetical protein